MRYRVQILKGDEVVLTSVMFDTRDKADEVKLYLWKLFQYSDGDLTFHTECFY